jgi:hypothetical protein
MNSFAASDDWLEVFSSRLETRSPSETSLDAFAGAKKLIALVDQRLKEGLLSSERESFYRRLRTGGSDSMSVIFFPFTDVKTKVRDEVIRLKGPKDIIEFALNDLTFGLGHLEKIIAFVESKGTTINDMAASFYGRPVKNTDSFARDLGISLFSSVYGLSVLELADFRNVFNKSALIKHDERETFLELLKLLDRVERLSIHTGHLCEDRS